MLRCRSVTKTYGGVKAVVDGTLDVPEGTFSCLVGPNGAGKTTFFNMISGVIPADSGTIEFRGETIDPLPAYQRARKGISRTFQDPRLFFEMSVRDHVLAGIHQRSDALRFAVLKDRATRADRRAALERADELLATVGLLHRAGHLADRLSFGEQRFLSIARALAANPSFLMLDEPTVGMDDEGVRKLEALIQGLVREAGVTVLMVEHNMEVVFRAAETMHLMLEGAVVASGPTAQMRHDPRLLEAYLGKRYAAHG